MIIVSCSDHADVTVVQLLSYGQLFVTPWTAAHQASLSFTISQSLLKLLAIVLVMSSKYLILWHPLLLLSSVFPSIRVFLNELTLHIRWPKYWSSASTSVLPINIQSWFPLGLTGLISLLPKGLSRVSSSTIVWKYQLLDIQSSLWSSPHICTWLPEKP